MSLHFACLSHLTNPKSFFPLFARLNPNKQTCHASAHTSPISPPPDASVARNPLETDASDSADVVCRRTEDMGELGDFEVFDMVRLVSALFNASNTNAPRV